MPIPSATSHAPARYSGPAIAFHWTTAVLILIAYVTVYMRIWGNGENGFLLYRIHTTVGVIAGVIAVLRLIWRQVSPPPAAHPASRIEHLAAQAMHVVLYAMMILIPLTGWMGTGNVIAWLAWTGIPTFSSTWIFQWLVEGQFGLTWEEFEPQADAMHQLLGQAVFWVLIALHAAAALFHQIVRRDGVLTSMLPARFSQR
ncbi:hypothetical protein ACO34A_24145 (plasmid) [Rhizobium sp. ACO-34A]|nr:hypothetical protein ACO34A_24145 [Rhizobium sp. ACO-34A]